MKLDATRLLAWIVCSTVSACSCSTSTTANDAGPDATSGGSGGESGANGGSGGETTGGDGGRDGGTSGRDGGGEGGEGGTNSTGGSGDEDAGPDANDDGGNTPEDHPDRFAIVNNTSTTLYVDANLMVSCIAGASAPQESCSFASYDCVLSCSDIGSGESCCVQCEQPDPRALRLAAGERYELAWDGQLFTRAVATCSECTCQSGDDVPSGTYRAHVRAFSDFTCEFGACAFDATDIALGARPSGASTEHSAELVIPSSADELVIELD